MASRSKTYGFSLYDVLTRIIPGLIVILSFSITPDLSVFNTSIDSISMGEILAVGVGAFLLGEIINLLRENWSPVPTTFRRVLYHETGDEDFLGHLDKYRLETLLGVPERRSIYANTEDNLYSELIKEFNLPADFDDVVDLYTLVVNYTDGDMSSRTERFQMMYTFTENFSWAMIVFAVIISYRGLVGDGASIALTFVLLLIQILVMMALVIAIDLYGRLEPIYVDSLLTEFFISRSE